MHIQSAFLDSNSLPSLRAHRKARLTRRTLCGKLALGLLSLVCVASADAKPSGAKPFALDAIFSNHVVLQREIPVPVWGSAAPGSVVKVDFDGQSQTATADETGKWMVKLPAMKAKDKGSDLTVVNGADTLTLSDVLVGDVYFCSGQSNMEMGMSVKDFPSIAPDLAKADIPGLRHYRVGGTATWKPSTQENAIEFSATAFFFGRKLHQELGVPIGLITNAKGSSRIERWIPEEGFPLVPGLVKADGKLNAKPSDRYGHFTKPTRALIPYAIKGMLWYQGEHNTWDWDNAKNYSEKMYALVTSMRQIWGQGEFPFYYVQLPQFNEVNEAPSGGGSWAKVRLGQLRALSLTPNSHMAVTLDSSDKSIHPDNKQDVGDRLARLALVNDYGKKDLTATGPLFKSMKVEGDKIRISFDHVGKGLMTATRENYGPVKETPGSKVGQLAIAGIDPADASKKKLIWAWADAVIDGDTIVASSPEIKAPVAVQYANSNRPTGANLFNKDGLPASPFLFREGDSPPAMPTPTK